MNISFGQRIPIAKVQIPSTFCDKFEQATVYEIDCQDNSDAEEMNKISSGWRFRKSIRENMIYEIAINKISSQPSLSRFFILETDKGSIEAICQTCDTSTTTEIDYIESNPQKDYKYAGQTLLASIGMNSLKEEMKKLIIPCPTSNAFTFYTDKCGFNIKDDGSLSLGKKGIKKFIRKTQKDIHSPILNTNA